MNSVEPKRQGGIGVVLAIVALDFAGIGLTLPIIPRLLGEVAHTTDLGWRFGAFLSLYALMQFVFSPILGIWSDRVGRRPVLLCSLAGAAVDYLFMAIAPSLGLLFVGRAIAGITGASQAVGPVLPNRGLLKPSPSTMDRAILPASPPRRQ